MWVRLTFIKIQPDKVDEVRKIYYNEMVPTIKAQKGNVDIYLMEPVGEDEEFISLTSWDSKENGDSYDLSKIDNSNSHYGIHVRRGRSSSQCPDTGSGTIHAAGRE